MSTARSKRLRTLSINAMPELLPTALITSWRKVSAASASEPRVTLYISRRWPIRWLASMVAVMRDFTALVPSRLAPRPSNWSKRAASFPVEIRRLLSNRFS